MIFLPQMGTYKKRASLTPDVQGSRVEFSMYTFIRSFANFNLLLLQQLLALHLSPALLASSAAKMKNCNTQKISNIKQFSLQNYPTKSSHNGDLRKLLSVESHFSRFIDFVRCIRRLLGRKILSFCCLQISTYGKHRNFVKILWCVTIQSFLRPFGQKISQHCHAFHSKFTEPWNLPRFPL